MLEKSIPFYIQITRILRQEIKNGRYPVSSRMPDETTLAARFGVSKDVIRMSMRQLGRDGVVKAIRSRGTFVCEPQNGEGGRILLLSYHGPLHLDAIRNGVEIETRRHGWDLVLRKNVLFDLAEERRILEQFDPGAFTALVAAPAQSLDGDEDNHATYEKLLRQGLPLLIVDHSMPNVAADEVSFDEYGATLELMREALCRAAGLPAVMFTDTSRPFLVTERYRAMRKAWEEAGKTAKDGRFFNVEGMLLDHARTAENMLNAYLESGFEASVFLFSNTPVAWEFFQRLRAAGKAENVRLLAGIGDIVRGDPEFNARLVAAYRLFDDFTPHIAEILHARFSGEAAPPTPIRRKLGFKLMDYQAIRQYYAKLLDRHTQ